MSVFIECSRCHKPVDQAQPEDTEPQVWGRVSLSFDQIVSSWHQGVPGDASGWFHSTTPCAVIESGALCRD